MNLSSIIRSSSHLGSSLLMLSFLVLNMIVAAHVDEEVCVQAPGRSCKLVCGGNYEVVKSTDEHQNISTAGSQGGFQIISLLPADPVEVMCNNKVCHLPPVDIKPNYEWTYSFDVQAYVWPWRCSFQWINAGNTYMQRFDVWNHDGSYAFLFNCDFCVWAVHSDGFYILKDDNFFLAWKWEELNFEGTNSSAADAASHLSLTDHGR